ncbi:glucosaminidase domain-containing protein [Sulfobacillus harzensis]|uniref:Glucosaminidase domain-containing protein n=1 Tax=Sulfobacillus harzensis TaxID=2729629 RepID=A0A7Y0L1F7_9FIRM|nr:glucosaminidase domain-containing protein [Sulfobacillus harzensis]NMP21313.1 glucosaminidase domain-containing protein [Sulfobacillus harzensis]
METLDGQSRITGVRRITRGQALAFTSTRPIGAVAGTIFDQAVALNIDPAFALAEAILETGWGTSGFARNRHNWYGYQAYFQDPNQAHTFESDEDGIRIPLEDMATHYFSPGGTYYAQGRGCTLAGWAAHWIDGYPAHWQRAMGEILSLMRSAINHPER